MGWGLGREQGAGGAVRDGFLQEEARVRWGLGWVRGKPGEHSRRKDLLSLWGALGSDEMLVFLDRGYSGLTGHPNVEVRVWALLLPSKGAVLTMKAGGRGGLLTWPTRLLLMGLLGGQAGRLCKDLWAPAWVLQAGLSGLFFCRSRSARANTGQA